MEKLIVASGNKGKLKEISEILKDKYEIVSMADAGFKGDIEENGKTFFENALIKAKTISEFMQADALADDSGLCVEALDGAPGIYSARYAGEHGNDAANRAKLLKVLSGEENRNAKFMCCVVLYRKDGTYICGRGETLGKIGLKEEGNNGFGYDSVFISDDLHKSFGVSSDEEKNEVSHRKRALIDLLRQI